MCVLIILKTDAEKSSRYGIRREGYLGNSSSFHSVKDLRKNRAILELGFQQKEAQWVLLSVVRSRCHSDAIVFLDNWKED